MTKPYSLFLAALLAATGAATAQQFSPSSGDFYVGSAAGQTRSAPTNGTVGDIVVAGADTLTKTQNVGGTPFVESNRNADGSAKLQGTGGGEGVSYGKSSGNVAIPQGVVAESNTVINATAGFMQGVSTADRLFTANPAGGSAGVQVPGGEDFTVARNKAGDSASVQFPGGVDLTVADKAPGTGTATLQFGGAAGPEITVTDNRGQDTLTGQIGQDKFEVGPNGNAQLGGPQGEITDKEGDVSGRFGQDTFSLDGTTAGFQANITERNSDPAFFGTPAGVTAGAKVVGIEVQNIPGSSHGDLAGVSPGLLKEINAGLKAAGEAPVSAATLQKDFASGNAFIVTGLSQPIGTDLAMGGNSFHQPETGVTMSANTFHTADLAGGMKPFKVK